MCILSTRGNYRRTFEGIRQAYARASEKHLATMVQASIGKDEVVNTARVEALKMFGYTEEELLALGDVTNGSNPCS